MCGWILKPNLGFVASASKQLGEARRGEWATTLRSEHERRGRLALQLPERPQFVVLTRPSWIATLRLAQGMVMSDTPIQREPPPKIDRLPAAHERRARLIAQLHEQAIATANDLAARREAIRAGVAKDALHRKAEAWLFSAGAFLLALGCIVAVGCMLAVWLWWPQ
jgi:hypothetical protein